MVWDTRDSSLGCERILKNAHLWFHRCRADVFAVFECALSRIASQCQIRSTHVESHRPFQTEVHSPVRAIWCCIFLLMFHCVVPLKITSQRHTHEQLLYFAL
jgi:hypothetical protein